MAAVGKRFTEMDMEPHEGKDQAKAKFQGFASNLLEEVVRADLSMHNAQLNAWTSFLRSRPKGAFINPDVLEGFPKERYLFLGEVTLSFNVRVIPTDSFLKRLKHTWRVLTGAAKPISSNVFTCEICEASERDAMALSIKVMRSGNGAFRTSVEATP